MTRILAWLTALAVLSPISTWALFGAGIVLSAMIVAGVLLLWLGGWSPASEGERIKYIGILCIMTALDLMTVIAALAKARLSAHGPGNTGFDVGSAGLDSPLSAVKTTTTTEVTP